jgi:TPR repeat protein
VQSSPLKHLLRAAESGDAAAQFHLGLLYDCRFDDNGYVIAGDRPEAMKWLLAAAQQGLPRAQCKVAEMYADGIDLPEDYISSCAWFILATPNLRGIHHHRAQSAYDHIASHLTPTQLESARRLAANWQSKPSTKPITAKRSAKPTAQRLGMAVCQRRSRPPVHDGGPDGAASVAVPGAGKP